MRLVASDPVAGGTLVLLRVLMGILGSESLVCVVSDGAMPPRRRGVYPMPRRRNEDNECQSGNCSKSRRIEASAARRSATRL